jgi:hypothetical protein
MELKYCGRLSYGSNDYNVYWNPQNGFVTLTKPNHTSWGETNYGQIVGVTEDQAMETGLEMLESGAAYL